MDFKSKYMKFYLSAALQALWTLAAFQILNLYTVGRIPWTGDQPVARPLPAHRINAHRHRCFEWDWNPRSQCPSGTGQFMSWTARSLEWAHEILFLEFSDNNFYSRISQHGVEGPTNFQLNKYRKFFPPEIKRYGSEFNHGYNKPVVKGTYASSIGPT
jgi:hypothetical protein